MKLMYGLLFVFVAVLVGEEWLSLLALLAVLLMVMYWVAIKAVDELEAKKNVDYDF